MSLVYGKIRRLIPICLHASAFADLQSRPIATLIVAAPASDHGCFNAWCRVLKLWHPGRFCLRSQYHKRSSLWLQHRRCLGRVKRRYPSSSRGRDQINSVVVGVVASAELRSLPYWSCNLAKRAFLKLILWRACRRSDRDCRSSEVVALGHVAASSDRGIWTTNYLRPSQGGGDDCRSYWDIGSSICDSVLPSSQCNFFFPL